MSATQRVQVLSRDTDAVTLRVFVIHPDEGDLVPDRSTALQWLVAALPAAAWSLGESARPSEEGPALARLLREARIETFAQLAWWLLENERRVVDVELLAERNVDAVDEDGAWVIDLSRPETLPQADVRVRVGAASLLDHVDPGAQWECAPFPPLSANPEAPPPRPSAPAPERLGLRATLEAHSGETLDLGWQLRWEKGDAERLAEWPGLEEITHFCLRRPIGDEGAEALAASPHARGVRRLALEAVGLGGPGLGAIARSPAWPELRELALAEDALGEAVLRVRGTPLWGRLTALELSCIELRDQDALELLDDPPPALRALTLNSNGLRDPAVIEAALRIPNLEALDLGGEDFDESALLLLFAADARPLARLGLAGTALSSRGSTRLSSSPHWRRLRALDLTNTALSDTDLATLANGPVAPELEELRLYNLPLGLGTLSRLVASASLPALRRIRLGSNGFDPSDAGHLGDGVELSFDP